MPSSARRAARAALLTLLTFACTAAPAAAGPPFPITESFTNSTMETGWTLGSSATLTAPTDGDGNGWLRLTGTTGNQFGYVFNDVAFPSTNGVLAEFDYATWGGTGADGLVFFLYDGATAAGDFQAGPAGGSLGYSHCPATATPGLNNAYIGVGLDEWGNFSLASFCNQGGVENGSTLLKNRVTVRAGEGGAEPYKVLASQVTSQPLIATRAQARHVTVAISNGLLSTYIRYPDGQVQTVARDVALPAGAPPTLKLGFVASTGGSHNNHEIRNTKVVEPVNLVTTVSDGVAGAQRGTHTWTATVRNAGPNDTTAADVDATTATTGLTDITWTCTASSGSCGATSGTGLPNTSATLPSGATATYTITANTSGVADAVALSLDAQPTGDTGELDPLDNASSDSTVLSPINDAAPTFTYDGTTATRTSVGTWRGGSLTHALQWQICATDGTDCQDTGQTGTTYTPTSAVTGKTFRLAVTATNAGGSATAYSDPATPPTTSITTGPASVVRPYATSISFTGSGSSFQCRLDGGSWTACSSPWTGDVAAGQHTLEVRSHSGHLADPTPATHTWTVDDTTSVTLSGPSAGPTRSNRPKISFTGVEAGTFVVRIGGAVVGSGTLDGERRGEVVPEKALADGEHDIEVEVTDAVGNVATDQVRIKVVTSVKPPVLETVPPTTAPKGEQTVTWKTDTGTTSRCRLNGGSWQACTSPATFTGLAAGEYVLDVEVLDELGNVSDTVQASWRVAGTTERSPATCTSRRRFDVHWTLPGRRAARTVRVLVDGKLVRRLTPGGRKFAVDLRGRSRSTVRVRIEATDRSGRRFATTRTYRPCTPKTGRRQLPTIVLAPVGRR